APDTAAPDTAAPDTAAPDTAAPDTAAPDTAAPDTAAPDTAAPDTAAPDTAAPDTAAPDTAAPDTAVPDAAAPGDTAVPDAAAPGGTAVPDAAAPGGTAAPDTAAPGGTAAPDTAAPGGTAAPDTAAPDTAAARGQTAAAPGDTAPTNGTTTGVPTSPVPDGRSVAASNGAATAAPPHPGTRPHTEAAGVAAPGPAAPTEPIAPTEGRLERLRGKLARSRSGFGQGLLGILGAGELDEESWEDVEATLLQADLGPEMTQELVERLRSELARRGVRTAEQARALLRDVLTDALAVDLDRSVRALPHDGRPAVLLVVGVNGTGKTTTTGKLARVLVADGRHVVLGAADTFRAAAAEQLTTWGERAGATVVRGPEGADPASVAFDAVKQAHSEGADAVLLDTAGRLHTKTGLMDELGKVKRVVSRQAEVDEVLLVLDATTGQNGLMQARVFGEVVEVTGIVLTKLDGTAKGGIVFRVQRELGVPVKLVGLGEGPDDLAPFVPGAFVDALLN
ncbi:MAG: signal recognition particle-docking protein FtsY, partial [Pseudonocardia sp.]